MLDAKCLLCERSLDYDNSSEIPGKGYICKEPCNLQAGLGEFVAGAKELPFRVVHSADVTLIAQTIYDDLAVEKWCQGRGMEFETDALHDSDALSEFAGRTCYLSFNQDRRRKAPEGQQNETYLNHIKKVGHTSVIEHASWTFVIDDFSKNCSQELVRHRVGVAYSIQSSRYVDQFSGKYFGDSGYCLGIYVPPEVQRDQTLFQEWIGVWTGVVEVYRRTIDKFVADGWDEKDARSLARHILPGGMCNAIVFTVNARELNHIFKMRCDPAADPEIRRMVMRLWDHVNKTNIFNHYEEVEGDERVGRYLQLKAAKRPVSKLETLLARCTEDNQHPENGVVVELGSPKEPSKHAVIGAVTCPIPFRAEVAIAQATVGMPKTEEWLKKPLPVPVPVPSVGLGIHHEDTNELMENEDGTREPLNPAG